MDEAAVEASRKGVTRAGVQVVEQTEAGREDAAVAGTGDADEVERSREAGRCHQVVKIERRLVHAAPGREGAEVDAKCVRITSGRKAGIGMVEHGEADVERVVGVIRAVPCPAASRDVKVVDRHAAAAQAGRRGVGVEADVE